MAPSTGLVTHFAAATLAPQNALFFMPDSVTRKTHFTTHIESNSLESMDIESFYEQNEARRESAEFEFGSEWTDASDNEYELSWVEATGELYLMVEPEAIVNEDIFGDFLVSDEVISDLTVVVIGKVASLAALEDALQGWEDAMLDENSLEWLYERYPQN
jgi:hypothetical protein